MTDDWNAYREQLKRAKQAEIDRRNRDVGKDEPKWRPSEDLPLDQADPGPTKVRSKQMSLAELNALILAFRGGDKKAETKLYLRYIRRINMLMRKSPWYDDIKDPESLAIDIWMKLCEWFQENTIEKGEGAVIANRVRGMCRDQAVKDQRETAAEIEQVDFNDTKPSSATIREILALWATQRDLIPGFSTKRFTESQLNMHISFRKILAKCLGRVPDKKLEALDRNLYDNETMEKIGESFNVSHVTISNYIDAAIQDLKNCFGMNDVPNLGAIL